MNCILNCSLLKRLFPLRFSHLKLVESKYLSTSQFEEIADETLESIHEYVDDLIDECNHLADTDSAFSSGVLTLKFGKKYGTYVINRQTPNKQIWLSSPSSGPKRYDYLTKLDAWVYKHNNQSLHELLQSEIPAIVEKEVNFFKCKHSGSEKKS